MSFQVHKNGEKGTTINIASLSSIIPGFTYVDGYVNSGGTTKPTSGAVTSYTLPQSGNVVINLYYRRNHVFIKYNVNGGTLASVHGAKYGMIGENISSNNVLINTLVGAYGSKIYNMDINTYAAVNPYGFANYNNPTDINIVRSGYTVESGKEWFTLDEYGNKTEYNQGDNQDYDANDFASSAGYDLSTEDAYITIYVNWIPCEYNVVFDATGGECEPSSTTVEFGSEYGQLSYPLKSGYTFTGWSLIPNDYVQVDFIESNGNSYIDTGYKPNTRTGVDVTYQFTETYNNARIFGEQGLNEIPGTMNYEVYISASNKLSYGYKDGAGNWVQTQIDADTNLHRILFNVEGNTFKVDDDMCIINNQSTIASPYNMYMMTTNQEIYQQGQVGGRAKIKIYNFSIYEAGVIQKKFVPCVRKSDGKVGMYELVSGVFCPSLGTENAIAGPEVQINSETIVSTPFDHTLYANWTVNNYTIEYYQGNNEQEEEEVTLLGSSLHTYNVAANLNPYTGTAPNGWEFAGWSSIDGITGLDVVYTDQQSIINLTEQSDGIVRLYAIFKRTIEFNSGENEATTSTEIQYYNPYITTQVSEVLAPAPSLTGLSSYGWEASGYRIDTTASAATYEVTTEDTNISPEYNVGNSSTTVNLYAVYTRDLTLRYNGNGNTGGATPSHTSPQKYNTNGARTSVIFVTKSNGFTRTGYQFYKWANDSTSGAQVVAGGNAAAFSPVYNSNATTKTMYAIWNAINYPITYDLDGGTVSPANPTSYTIETETFTLTNPTRDGYTFVGWTGSNGTTPELSVTIASGSTGSKSYTANWRQNKVVVNIQRNEVEWSNSGMKVALYQNGVEKYSTIVTSGTMAVFEFVEPGVYDIYAGKNSNEKNTLVDTGKDITVGNTNSPS